MGEELDRRSFYGLSPGRPPGSPESAIPTSPKFPQFISSCVLQEIGLQDSGAGALKRVLPLGMMAKSAINSLVNRRHGRTLQAIFVTPVNGNIEWRRIEALLLALGASRTERAGAAVSFELNGVVAQFHRPHPDKATLRYRAKDARAFLSQAGVGP